MTDIVTPTRYRTMAGAYDTGFADAHALAYVGAADNSGDPDKTPTPAEWIRRFLDLDAAGRLMLAEQAIRLTMRAVDCMTEHHEKRIGELEALRDEHAAVARRVQHLAAERAWDACANEADSPDERARLLAANPCRTR